MSTADAQHEAEARRTTFDEVLWTELRALRPEFCQQHTFAPSQFRTPESDGVDEPHESKLRELYSLIGTLEETDPAGSQPALSALCLSGGGIRSATFNLGVLQALARCGMLLLNWMVIVPLLAALVAIPQGLYLVVQSTISYEFGVTLLWAALIVELLASTSVYYHRRFVREPRHPASQYLALCVLPIVAAGGLLSAAALGFHATFAAAARGEQPWFDAHQAIEQQGRRHVLAARPAAGIVAATG